MTYAQRPETGRAAPWLVVVLALAAVLAWWWWSGRGPATLASLDLLPSPSASTESSASPAPAPTGPAASTLDAASAADDADTTDPASSMLVEIDDDDLTSVSGVVTLADATLDTESDDDDASDTDADADSDADEVVAISGFTDSGGGDGVRPSAIAYPLPALPAGRTLEPDDVDPALNTLVQPGAAAEFLQNERFAHRFVATVDNLGRSYAPASRWPVNPAPDRFTFEERDGRTYIAPDNYKRYAPLVQLAETLDTQAVIDMYARMYPQLQAAYADLGFPDAYFNDRLIAVMDLLLASPEPSGPLEVEHTKVPNRPDPAKPWANYQFADPDLDALAAGQKIMVRVGPDNQRRLKAKLAALRQELLTRVLPGQ